VSLTYLADTSSRDQSINVPAKPEPVLYAPDPVRHSIFKKFSREPRAVVAALLSNDIARVRSTYQSLPTRFLAENNPLRLGDADVGGDILSMRYRSLQDGMNCMVIDTQ
jgi:hypothetical protein